MPNYTLRSLTAAIATAATLMFLGAVQISLISLTFAAIPMIYFALSAPFAALALSLNFTSIILLGVHPELCLFFIMVIAVPCLFLIAHIRRGSTIGIVLAELAIYATLVVVAIQCMLIGHGGLEAMILKAFEAKNIADFDPQIKEQLLWASREGGFIIVAAAAWWGILLFYASAWLACALKSHQLKTNLRPLVTLAPFTPPAMLFLALVLCVIISLLFEGPIAFIGTSGFVIILLPYCFSGAMYTPLRKWRGMQTGWMFPAMILFMVFAWPAAILCTIGIWKHAERLLRLEN